MTANELRLIQITQRSKAYRYLFKLDVAGSDVAGSDMAGAAGREREGVKGRG